MTNAAAAQAYETHTAYVMMLGDVAYKMKKPVRNSFVDFSTPALRRLACEREYELNCRFSPDVYLGVGELTHPDGGPPEALLEMRRLPDRNRMSGLASRGAALTNELRDVAVQLASAHSAGKRSAEIDQQALPSAVSARWAENIAEMADSAKGIVSAEVLMEIDQRARRYLAGRTVLFKSRIAQHRVVDGHGDLLSDDIFCLTDGVRILDCLDFDDNLRYLDGIDDAACLTMDLEFQGRPELASEFMAMYRHAAQDTAPSSLRHFYIAYRALVRSKVACIRFRQGVDAAREDARKHAKLALDHLRLGEVKLALVGGLPGTGKTTLAAALAIDVDAVVLSSDVIRKELHGFAATSPHPEQVGEGIYSASNTDHTYAELLTKAREYLINGRSVVLDASWTDRTLRERAALVATCTHSDFVEIECHAPRELALARIGARRGGASDANRDVYEDKAFHRDPWPSAVVVDTAMRRADGVDVAELGWGNGQEWRVP